MKFTIIITLLTTLLLPPLVLAEPDLLVEANQFFGQAVDTENQAEAAPLLDKALLRYEQLYRDHPTGRLAYNIGNTYYQLGNKPMALVYYKRAITTMPQDQNLRHNMEIVRNELQLKENTDQDQTRWLPAFILLQHWHVLGLYALFWITASVRYAKKSFMPLPVPTLLLFLCLAGSTLIGMERLQPKSDQGVIISSDTIGRQGNGRNFEPCAKEPLQVGLEFTVLEKRGYWLRIELDQDKECWIPSRSCEII